MEVKLELFSEADIPKLISWIDYPGASDLWASRTYHYPLSKDKVLEQLAKTQRIPLELVIFKVTNKNGEVLGHAELDKFDHQVQSARITRIFIDPKYRNKGIGKSAINLLLSYCFEKLALNRVELYVLEKNFIALNVYKKAGFEIEGLIRNNMLIADELHSSYILSILRSEYEFYSSTPLS